MLARDARANWEDCAERIRTESHFSPWLKHHLRQALARPGLEALEDAEVLRAMLHGRLGEQRRGDPMLDVPLPALDPLVSAGEQMVPVRLQSPLPLPSDPSAPDRTELFLFPPAAAAPANLAAAISAEPGDTAGLRLSHVDAAQDESQLPAGLPILVRRWTRVAARDSRSAPSSSTSMG